ncbi:MAG TPA: hypothetical protein VM939_14720 [Gemmatimonadaceae bacterium]|nr:hypothetical protein [Gemmatimonadaceae bacterium]
MHLALQKSPPSVRALFRHTEEYRAAKMARMYARRTATEKPQGTLLFWVPGGMPLLLHVESAIAAAMRLRGYRVHAIICNSPYRGCAIRTATDGLPIEKWRDVCPQCISKTSRVLETMGIPFSYNGDFVTDAERAELWERTEGITWDSLDSLDHDGLRIGRNIRSTVVRYLQGAALTGYEAIVREYAYSGLVSALAARRALERHKPWRVLMSHGTYVDWGPALQTALSIGVPVTGWKASYLPSHFYLRHVDDPSRIDLKKLSAKAWSELAAQDLTDQQNARLDRFFKDRYHKLASFDMKNAKTYRHDIEALRAEYAIGGRPVWAVFAHVNWDSVTDFAPMAYPSFDEWILDTIREAIEIPQVQWLIKVHPVEARDNPATGVQRLIERHFPELPDHVRVIGAEADLSPANLYELVDGGVTVYGTAGLELALLGKPVVVSGEAHYGGKGFTHEGLTPDTYRRLLRQIPVLGPLTPDQRECVRKYAYSHFIAREIPIETVRDPASTWWSLQSRKLDTLEPGKDPFVEFICDRLLDGRDFNMGESLVSVSPHEVEAT